MPTYETTESLGSMSSSSCFFLRTMTTAATAATTTREPNTETRYVPVDVPELPLRVETARLLSDAELLRVVDGVEVDSISGVTAMVASSVDTSSSDDDELEEL
jgi:hypothetical protein